jgi:hypothetical protein
MMRRLKEDRNQHYDNLSVRMLDRLEGDGAV